MRLNAAEAAIECCCRPCNCCHGNAKGSGGMHMQCHGLEAAPKSEMSTQASPRCAMQLWWSVEREGRCNVVRRANAQQPKLFVGMILILIFAEALALYGLIGKPPACLTAAALALPTPPQYCCNLFCAFECLHAHKPVSMTIGEGVAVA